MDESVSVLLEYQAAVDYCIPEIISSDPTQQVVNHFHGKNVKFDIRKICWDRLNTTIYNTQRLFKTIRTLTTEALRNGRSEEGLVEDLVNVFEEKEFRGKTLKINEKYIPSKSELQSIVEENGLEQFRAYADDQIQICTNNQATLNLIIRNKYQKGGQSVGLFGASIESHFDSEQNVEMLTSAYTWGNDVKDLVLACSNSQIYAKREKIKQCMRNPKFNIISPKDIIEYAN